MILCGSRFCTPAESRYHPIEGELLGVAWALEKTGYYTLGCKNLLVLVDHKPLIGLLTTRELGAIQNPRLEHLAERLLRWTFRIEHVAGASNYGPDALSRFPGPTASLGSLGTVNLAAVEWSNNLEGQVRAIAASRRTLVISWKLIRDAGASDHSQSTLLHALAQDDDSVWDTDEALKPYKKFRDDMSTVDGVPLYKGRIIIPQPFAQTCSRRSTGPIKAQQGCPFAPTMPCGGLASRPTCSPPGTNVSHASGMPLASLPCLLCPSLAHSTQCSSSLQITLLMQENITLSSSIDTPVGLL